MGESFSRVPGASMNQCIKNWRGESDCQSCEQRASVLFAGVEERHLAQIRHSIDDISVEAGDALYRGGDAGECIFTVRSGLLKLVQYLPDGNRRIVRLIRGNDVVGLEALLGQPYQHDAIVLQSAAACRIPVGVLRQLDKDNPGLTQELMRRWQRALTEADAWLTELSTGSARQRIARLLLRLVDEEGNGVCELFGREDIGAMLGITTETASRIIAEFRRNGLIVETEPDRFRCQPGDLEKIAGD
jgi:CRP/FNR family transcriptional regulator